MDGTAGQAAIGLVAGLGLLILATAALAVAIVGAAPAAWEATIAERARARHGILGTPREMHPRWPPGPSAPERSGGS